jgi:hypothetical protein
MPNRTALKVIFEIALDEDGRWLVRLFKNVYAEYTDKGRVRRDALKAAADARQLGY